MLLPGNERTESPTPDWTPTPEFIATTNIAWLMQRVGVGSYEELHAWSVRNRAEYWKLAIERLGVQFDRPFREVLDLSEGIAAPQWLPGARMNIVESCFSAPSKSPAILHQAKGGELSVTNFAELKS